MRSLLFLSAAFVVGVQSAASILNAESPNAIPNSYIVVLKKSVSDAAVTSHLNWADGVLQSRSAARKSNSTFSIKDFKGYVLKAPKAVAALLAESDEARSVNPNGQVHKLTRPDRLHRG